MGKPASPGAASPKPASPKLTLKQEAFVRGYLETGNASEAYRRAYDAGGMADNAVHVKACELLKNGKVAVMVDQHRSKAEAKTLMTVETHLARLAELSKLAQEAGQLSAAITAETKRGEVLGYYVQRSQNVNHNYAIADKPMAPEAWAAQYAQPEPTAPMPEAAQSTGKPAADAVADMAQLRARFAALRGDGPHEEAKDDGP